MLLFGSPKPPCFDSMGVSAHSASNAPHNELCGAHWASAPRGTRFAAGFCAKAGFRRRRWSWWVALRCHWKRPGVMWTSCAAVVRPPNPRGRAGRERIYTSSFSLVHVVVTMGPFGVYMGPCGGHHPASFLLSWSNGRSPLIRASLR